MTNASPSLLEVQRAVSGGMRRGAASAADTWIKGDEISGLERIGIYRNTSLATRVTVLRLAFPAVRKLVGEDFFEESARRFAGAYRVRGALLDDYGSQFPRYLARLASAASVRYLADVAALEWAISRALHASDADPLDLSRLAALSPESASRLVLKASPALRLLQPRWPADQIWHAVLDNDHDALSTIRLREEARYLLVERRERRVHVQRLSVAAWQFTRALCAGRPLHEALTAIGDAGSELLAEHLAAGRFIDFSFAEPQY